MLNRSQIHTLLLLRKRESNENKEKNVLFQFPVELIREISELGQNPDSDFDKALKHVIYGNLPEAKAILEGVKNDKTKLKELLLSSGTAVTRSGLTVMHKTLLECAIGESDPEMIEMLKSYFPQAGCVTEMEKQIERYRLAIDTTSAQKPKDLTWLIDIIKASSFEDVAEELKTDDYNPSYKSLLRDAMNKFREQKLDPKDRVIKKPQMHCNYKNLDHAYELLDAEWNNLIVEKNGKKDYSKHDLIALQIIGLIHLLELPAYERFLCARDQVVAKANGEKIEVERNVNYKYGGSSFPNFDPALIKSRSGFGFDSFSSIYGARRVCGCGGGGTARLWGCAAGALWGRAERILQILCRAKTTDLQNLCSNTQSIKHLGV